MNTTQKILLALYLPATVLILIFDHLYPGADMVLYLKYITMVTLFLFTRIIRKKTREQRIMALSFFFMVIADFFLVFSDTIDGLTMNTTPFGIAGFLLAYLCLITAYKKKFKVGKREVIAAIPVVIIFLWVVISLYQYIKGPMLIGTLIFGMVLCYMTWTAISTIFRGYYNPKIAWVIALSGSLMFICDMGVAFSLFQPYFSQVHVPWLKNIIWGACIPGWTLLAVIISRKGPLEAVH